MEMSLTFFYGEMYLFCKENYTTPDHRCRWVESSPVVGGVIELCVANEEGAVVREGEPVVSGAEPAPVLSMKTRGSQGDVVYLGRPIALSYMSPNTGVGGCFGV
jgi:hypothetical protein